MSEATQFGEVRILHFGDVFFGSPFLSPAPEKSAERRRLQRETFERAMQTIRDQKVHLALISGNLFDADDLSDETAGLLLRGFRSCPACRFVILPAGADPAGKKSFYASGRFPQNVRVFGAGEYETFSFDEIGVSVTGRGSGERGEESAAFPTLSKKDEQEILILLGYRREIPDNTEIVSVGADYIALSGRPDPSVLEIGGSVVGYSGWLESRGYENEQVGGANLLTVTVEAGARRLHVKRLDLGTVRCLSRTIDVSDMKNDSELIGAITSIVRDNALGRTAVLRIELTGTVTPGFRIPRNAGTGSFGLLVFSLVNLTAPESDPQLLKDMSARGELYRLLEPKIREGADDAERAAAARALTIGLAALEGQEIKDL